MTEKEASLMKAIYNAAADARMGGFHHVSDALFQVLDQLDIDIAMTQRRSMRSSLRVIQGGKR